MLSRGTRRRILLVGAIVVGAMACAALALGVACARTCFDESIYTAPGRFAYYACVSSLMRNMPRVKPDKEPNFFASAGDGPKPAEDGITYHSRATPNAIIEDTVRYLATKGFTANVPAGAGGTTVAEGEESTVTISIRPFGPGISEVRVSQKFF